MSARRLQVWVHGHLQEVSEALLAAEISRDGPPPRLPLIEAIVRHAPRPRAVARLAGMLDQAPLPSGLPHGHGPSEVHLSMHAALGLLGMSPRSDAPEEAAALAALSRFAARVGGAAGATVQAGVVLLERGPAALLPPAVDADAIAGAPSVFPADLLLRQSPRALAVIEEPGPLVPHLPPLCAAWMAALERAGRTHGAHAFRAFLGDVSEALYRVLLRGDPPCRPADLLAEPPRATLLDMLAVELPGTADFLAARAMAWAIGALAAPGTLEGDDAGAVAIQRARDRFRNEEFHADCAVILSGGGWPPQRALKSRKP